MNRFREKVLSVAASQDGVEESPPYSNNTKYGEWFGMNRAKWCAIFVSWVFSEAGYPLGRIDTNNGFSSCENGFKYWEEKCWLTENPEPGDIVLFELKPKKGRANHTGVFVRWLVEGRRFESWEGNTSSSGDNDGGHVMLHERHVDEVKAFVNPFQIF